MKKFDYQAKNFEGRKIKGVVEARDEKHAVKLLRDKELIVVSLIPHKKSLVRQIKSISRVKMDDRVNFSRQLATMMDAGLPLTQALSILEAQAKPAMAKVITEIIATVEGGGSLADALEEHPQVFDSVYVALIRSGEAAGILDRILNRLARNLEKQRSFQSKVKSALVYPSIIVGGMALVALIMVIFVVPRLSILYEEFEAELPFITRFLINISKFASAFWWLGALLVVAALYVVRLLLRQPSFRRSYEKFYFQIPIIGSLRRQLMLTEFSRTLGLLIGTGILIVDALNVIKDSLGSQIYHDAVSEATSQVEKGLPLAVALAKTEIFPPLLPQMIAVGEETGKIDEVLKKISSYFEQEATLAVKGLTSALEPIIMIILGVGVGFLIISVVMPIYNLTSQF